MHILHIKACQVECIGHFAFGVATLFTNNGSHRSLALRSHRFFPCKMCRERILQRLFRVILITLSSLVISCLLLVQEVRGKEPYISAFCYIESIGLSLVSKDKIFPFSRSSYLGVTHPLCIKISRYGVICLEYHSHILGKENLEKIVLTQSGKVYLCA